MLPGLFSNLHCLHDWTVHLLRTTGPTFFFKGPPLLSKMNFLFTCDPANANHILKSAFNDYPKGPDFPEIFDPLGNGLIVADEDSWTTQRKAAHCLLAEAKFRGFVAETSKGNAEHKLVPMLARAADLGEVVDMEDVLLRLTFDTSCNIFTGVDPKCLSDGFPDVLFGRAIDDVEEVLALRHVIPMWWWKLMRWLNVGHEKKLASARETIDAYVMQIVRERREANYEASPDMVSNPYVENKIYEELKARFGEADEQTKVFDVESLRGFVYLHAALCEVVRLYPSVPINHKWAAKADVLPSGVSVEAGTRILISMYAMGRMERVWGKDCEEFRPEQWITEHGTIKYEPPQKFLAFNAGTRTCLGKDVAFTQMKIVAAAVIYNFKVEAVEGHVVEPRMSVVLHMKNGFLAKVRKRREC
ncbi:Cytochrome P450 86B1 [Acorus gramineus]|uniref:Cytochrome P450 86B1 n=1 Tax=Acorus gramineus TaxID=55184 RepID=A0AAV9AJI9_ACOGR|nr:Cytochrome P450 86B1 [Acorus gramineus]